MLCCCCHRLYIATGQETYKKAAFDYYMKHYKEEDGPGVWDNFDWDSHSWAAVVLLQRWVHALDWCRHLFSSQRMPESLPLRAAAAAVSEAKHSACPAVLHGLKLNRLFSLAVSCNPLSQPFVNNLPPTGTSLRTPSSRRA